LQSLQRGIAQADSTAALRLSDARHLAIAALIRSNPRTVGADPRGEAIVRDEILAYAPSEAGLAAARALGFDVRREQIEAELGWRLVVLQKPQNLSSDKALRKLRAADPAGTYEFNHLYAGGGTQGAVAERDAVRSDAPASIPATTTESQDHYWQMQSFKVVVSGKNSKPKEPASHVDGELREVLKKLMQGYKPY